MLSRNLIIANCKFGSEIQQTSMVSRIINKCTRIRNDVFFKSFTPNSFIKNNFQNTIIMYHGVDSIGRNPFNTRHTGVSDFSKQLKFIKKYCNILTLSDFFEQKFIKNKVNISITFDDGYLNNYTIAKPVLEDMEIPATFFITGLNQVGCDILWADYVNIVSRLYNRSIEIDGQLYVNVDGVYYAEKTNVSLYDYVKKERADFEFKLKIMKAFDEVVEFKSIERYCQYWKLMTDEQIIETSKSKYVDIGSHGFLHNNLGSINHESACAEITSSIGYLQDLIQDEIDSIAYPDGSYTRGLLTFAANSGIKYQLAAEGFLYPEDETDNRILDRKGIYSCDSTANQLFNALK